MELPFGYRNATRASRMCFHILAGSLLICLLTGCQEPASAFEVPEQDTLAGGEQAVEFNPRMGRFYYVIEWGRARAADATITISREGGFYRMVADQETTPFLDRIYRIRYRGETLIKTEDLLPKQTVITGELGSRQRVDEFRYKEGGGGEAVVTKTKPRSPPEREVYEIDSESFAIDIFAAVFLARSFDWQEGESQQLEIFNDEKHYLVRLDCLGKAIFEQGDIRTPAWVIRPGSHNLEDPQATTSYSETRIYLSADESRDLLKIRTSLGFGTIRMKLVEYHPG